MGKRLAGVALLVFAAGVGFYQWYFYISRTVLIKPSPGVGTLFWASTGVTVLLVAAGLWLLFSKS